MLSKKLQEAINAQVNAEMWSAYLYLSMSLDASNKGYKGVANWFAVQFKEEQDHAQIFINYMLSRGCEVKLAPIAEVRTSWDSILDAYKDTLAHEKKVTAMIDNIARIAEEEKDFATSNMLAWFIDEQMEEEDTADDMITKMRLFGCDARSLYELNQEYAARTYTVPAPLANA